MRLGFLETVEDHDYFRARLPAAGRHAQGGIALWLRTRVSERALAATERSFTLLGFFEGDA